MKELRPPNRQMANETFNQLMRVITKDAFVKPESIQVLIDLVRESSKVTGPIAVSQVFDSSFVETVRKELGLTK